MKRLSSGIFTTKLNFIFPVISFPLFMCFTTSFIPLALSVASTISAMDMEAFPINLELDATLAEMFSSFLTENFQFKLLHRTAEPAPFTTSETPTHFPHSAVIPGELDSSRWTAFISTKELHHSIISIMFCIYLTQTMYYNIVI